MAFLAMKISMRLSKPSAVHLVTGDGVLHVQTDRSEFMWKELLDNGMRLRYGGMQMWAPCSQGHTTCAKV